MIRQFKITVSIKEVRSHTEPDIDIASAHASHFIDERAYLAAQYPTTWLLYELETALREPTSKLAVATNEHLNPETKP